jgi:hypothetical protein
MSLPHKVTHVWYVGVYGLLNMILVVVVFFSYECIIGICEY